jgi:WD40 repeat protein
MSHDCERIVTGSNDLTIKIWSAITGQVMHTLQGHTKGVFGTDLSVDGLWLASGGGDRTVKLWSLKKDLQAEEHQTVQHVLTKEHPTVKHTLTGHRESVNAVAFSLDCKHLASASDDGTVMVWIVGTGEKLTTYTGHSQCVYCVTWSPDGHVSSCGEDMTVQVWEGVSGVQQMDTLRGHNKFVVCVLFAPKKKMIISGSEDTTIIVWSRLAHTQGHGIMRLRLQGHKACVRSLGLSPGETCLVSAGADKTIRLWDFDTGQPMSVIEGHCDGVWRVLWSADGHSIVSASFDGTACVWRVRREVRMYVCVCVCVYIYIYKVS